VRVNTLVTVRAAAPRGHHPNRMNMASPHSGASR